MGKKRVAAAAASSSRERAQKKSKKEEQCEVASASNQNNHFLNMDLLSMSMILDMVGLGGMLAVAQTSSLAKERVRTFFQADGRPAHIVQKDIDYWLESTEEFSIREVEEAVDNDYFLSLKTWLASGMWSVLGKMLVFAVAVEKDYLKLIKWILAKYEIDRRSHYEPDYWAHIFLRACLNEGHNSLTIFDIVCRNFAVTKEELVTYGAPSKKLPMMKYFFDRFDLTGSGQGLKWRVKCLYQSINYPNYECLKYLVDCVGVTAAEGEGLILKESNGFPELFEKAFLSNHCHPTRGRDFLPYSQCFIAAFQISAGDFTRFGGWRVVDDLATAKWLIQLYKINVRANDYRAVRFARTWDILKYFLVEFGITEEEARTNNFYKHILLNHALSILDKEKKVHVFEWLRTNQWSMRPNDLKSRKFFELVKNLLTYAVRRPGPSQCAEADALLYLFEKLNYNIAFACKYDSRLMAAACREAIRIGWIRFVKCIIQSCYFIAGPKLSTMVTMAARRGKFALVKYFHDQGLYQLPSYIYLHHANVKLKLPKNIYQKHVAMADMNVEFDKGLNNQVVEGLHQNSLLADDGGDEFESDYEDDTIISPLTFFS